MAKSVWKSLYINDFFNKQKLLDNNDFIVVKRNEIILKSFLNKSFKIHNGNAYKSLLIKDSNMLYFKFGEFFLTKKKAIFKPKLKKK